MHTLESRILVAVISLMGIVWIWLAINTRYEILINLLITYLSTKVYSDNMLYDIFVCLLKFSF